MLPMNIRRTAENYIVRLAVGAIINLAFTLMKVRWFITRPATRGASAFCYTPSGRLILVRTYYEKGWNLPSGGLANDEDAASAILRELREEIGMVSYSTIEPLATMHHRPNYKRDSEEIFLVRDVSYQVGFNLEVEMIGEFDMRSLPHKVSSELRSRVHLCTSLLKSRDLF